MACAENVIVSHSSFDEFCCTETKWMQTLYLGKKSPLKHGVPNCMVLGVAL